MIHKLAVLTEWHISLLPVEGASKQLRHWFWACRRESSVQESNRLVFILILFLERAIAKKGTKKKTIAMDKKKLFFLLGLVCYHVFPSLMLLWPHFFCTLAQIKVWGLLLYYPGKMCSFSLLRIVIHLWVWKVTASFRRKQWLLTMLQESLISFWYLYLGLPVLQLEEEKKGSRYEKHLKQKTKNNP